MISKMGYTKLFNEIVLSTVWREPDTIRIVWITMLALRNRNHIVEASLPGLADCARVSIEDCKQALKYLSSPDPYSRSKELEGRRIQEVEGGWWIVNGEKYRRKMSEEERRTNNALYQRRYRERKKSVSTDLTNEQCQHSKSKSTEKESKEEEIYHAFPKKVGKPEALKSIRKALTKIPFDDLLSKTRAFAAARAGDLAFCPNPATWFNQERFNDDPSTWSANPTQLPKTKVGRDPDEPMTDKLWQLKHGKN